MSLCTISDDDIITFKALPFPLPLSTQQLLKNMAVEMKTFREKAENASRKIYRENAATKYNAAVLEFEQQEKLLRMYLGVEVSRPLIYPLGIPEGIESAPLKL